MKKNIFIGADGGGTKTKIIVEDESGLLLGQARSGPANIRNSVEQAWTSIDAGVKEALNQASIEPGDPNYHFHIGLGLAGTEDPVASQTFLSRPHFYTTLLLDSDAYAACLGVHDCADGAIIIIGTGVVGYEIYQGQRYVVGGWGFPQGDTGGGAWLGLEAVRLTFNSIDGRVPETPLLKAIFSYFDNDIGKIISWSTKARPVDFASLAPIVIEHIQREDPHAVALIERAAREIDEIAAAMERRLPAENVRLPCSLLGGVAPFVQPKVEEALKSRLVPRKHDATKGAIYMIRKKVQGEMRPAQMT
ncbi:MAG: ATPase [Proteobacteria bacterium]|nr:ATPase [Pseudomonadota bacterium]